MAEEHGVGRLTLVELIEAQKAKLSPEGREMWEELDASVYLSSDEDFILNPHEIAIRPLFEEGETDGAEQRKARETSTGVRTLRAWANHETTKTLHKSSPETSQT